MGCACDREREALISKRESALLPISELGFDQVYFDVALQHLQQFEKPQISFSELMGFLQAAQLSMKLIDYPNSPIAIFYQGLSRDQGYGVRKLSLILLMESMGTPTHKAMHLHQLFSEDGQLSQATLRKLLSQACKVAFTVLPTFAKNTAQRMNDTHNVKSVEKYMDRLAAAREETMRQLVRAVQDIPSFDADLFVKKVGETDLSVITSSKALRKFAVNVSFRGRLTEEKEERSSVS